MSADDDYQTWRGDGSAVTEPLTEFQHTSKYAHNRLKCPACAAEITREHIAAEIEAAITYDHRKIPLGQSDDTTVRECLKASGMVDAARIARGRP